MAISEPDKTRITAWCEARTPVEALDKLRVEATFRGDSAEIWDIEAPWTGDTSDEWTRRRVAKLTWASSRNSWTLFAFDGNDRTIRYSDEFRVPSTLTGVLREIEKDPVFIFWG